MLTYIHQGFFEICITGKQVVYKTMAETFFHGGACTGVPAKMIPDRTAGITPDANRAVHKGILEYLHI